MFYNNLSVASTYLLGLLAFSILIIPPTAYIYFKEYFKNKNNNFGNETKEECNS
jgi:hypothetical protein